MAEIYQYFTWLHVIWLAIGGAFGAALRYCVSQVLQSYRAAWPWATWSVNLLGALVLGFMAAYFNDSGYSPGFLFWEIGVLGGFTTMSTFAFETLMMVRARRILVAVGYIVGSALGGIGAIILGFQLGGLLS